MCPSATNKLAWGENLRAMLRLQIVMMAAARLPLVYMLLFSLSGTFSQWKQAMSLANISVNETAKQLQGKQMWMLAGGDVEGVDPWPSFLWPQYSVHIYAT